MNRRTFSTILIMIFCFIAFSLPVFAADTLVVAVNQSRVLTFYDVERVAIANPEIADVLAVSSSEVLLVGKKPGITSLHVWSMDGRQTFLVETAADDTQISNEIKNILGYNDIRISKVNKTIILEGTVNDQYQKARAEKVAGAYAEKVVNMLEITRPVQVKIEAKIIEINKGKLEQLGLKWGYNPASSPGVFYLGQSVTNTVSSGFPLGKLGSYADINAQLEALARQNVVKILSQPNMITLSGDKASIVVGGEIPIPVASDDNKISVEWKEYGIKLDIAPEVNGEGLINSKIKAEVSTLDWDYNRRIEFPGGLKIPLIKSRKAETAIALSSGQTMAIGGLISSQTSRDVTKVPLLADIPILGKLFKSTSFERGETELVILITPTIVNPAEYVPQTTAEMKGFAKENPWGGTDNGGKNKGADSR